MRIGFIQFFPQINRRVTQTRRNIPKPTQTSKVPPIATMAGRGRGRNNNSGWHKGSNEKRPRDMGRGQWARAQKDERLARGDKKRSRDDDDNNNNAETGANGSGDENQEAKKPKVQQRQARPLAEGEEREERRPKKKVAVLIGYCGTGYRGMQL